jgi:hypothetical protein
MIDHFWREASSRRIAPSSFSITLILRLLESGNHRRPTFRRNYHGAAVLGWNDAHCCAPGPINILSGIKGPTGM